MFGVGHGGAMMAKAAKIKNLSVRWHITCTVQTHSDCILQRGFRVIISNITLILLVLLLLAVFQQTTRSEIVTLLSVTPSCCCERGCEHGCENILKGKLSQLSQLSQAFPARLFIVVESWRLRMLVLLMVLMMLTRTPTGSFGVVMGDGWWW